MSSELTNTSPYGRHGAAHPLAGIDHNLHQRWTNWSGSQSATPTYTVRPRTEQEVIDTVRFAIREGYPVRALGAGHSFTPLVQTGGIMLDMRHVSAVTGTDAEKRRVRALGGTAIREFGPPLWEAGLSLANQGDVDHQSIAGALSTGTHGSGTAFGSFSSTLRGARILNGRGEVVEVTEKDVRELRAAQVSLGTLGILLEVELEVVPRYYLQEQITYPTWEESRASFDRDIAENRHYSFLWCPHEGSAELYELPTPDGLSMVNRSYTKRYNEVDVDEATDISTVPGSRRDRAYRIYPGGFGIPFHELEYYVESRYALEAVEAMQDLMRTRHPEQQYPLEVRWVKREEGLISPFQGRDTTVLSVSGAPGANYWPYLSDVDAMLRDYDARAHWGKIHMLTRDRVAELYPDFDEFVAVRREFDPNGVFLNDHTRALFG